MKGVHYKAICPYDRTPVHQQADFSYKCPTCDRTIPSAELQWVRIDPKEEKKQDGPKR